MPDKPIALDICIPVYGRADLLKKCLASIEATAKDIPYRLCIVDDASKDKKEILEALKGVRAIVNWNKQNSGFPTAANRCARMGTSPLIVFVNTDIELQSGALQAMMANFRDPTVGVVGSRLVFPENDRSGPMAGCIQHAGMAWTIHAVPAHIHLGWHATHPRVMVRRDDLDVVTGALMMVRRSAWERIGGFAEQYSPGTYEDCEACVRIRHELGMKIVYEPQALATHWVGASAQAAGVGFPLSRNRSVFLERMGKYLVWDEWKSWG